MDTMDFRIGYSSEFGTGIANDIGIGNNVLDWDPTLFNFVSPENRKTTPEFPPGLPKGYRYSTPPRVRESTPSTSTDTSPDNTPFTTPERKKRSQRNLTQNSRWTDPSPPCRKKDPAKEERNIRFKNFINKKIQDNSTDKFSFSDFQDFDPQTKSMPTDKLLNHINQLMANETEKELLSENIGEFLKENWNFTSDSEPVFLQSNVTKINVFRHIKKINCRCCNTNDITDIYCTKYCQIKTITIEKEMKYSQLFNLLSEYGFIKKYVPSYEHKSERKEKHTFFPTMGNNLHLTGINDLTIYFV